MRPCKVKKHLETAHKDKKEKPLVFFKNLRDEFQGRMAVNSIFTQKVAKIDRNAGFLQDINLIAKAAKPQTIGESLIMPAVVIVLSTVMKQSPQEVTSVIPLSNSSVSRRIDEMAADVESQLVLKLQVNEFSLQLDETTLPDNSALLMAFARFLDVDGIREELIFALKLTTDTKGESIFKKLEAYFEENNIPLKNIVACATDGAAAMIGRYRGFSAYLKKAVPNVVCVHCVVHRQHLVAKNLAGRLHEALGHVIKALNLIKKNALQYRPFQQLCGKNNEELERLVLHTEVRWLSKGNCLQRFVTLWGSVISFLSETERGQKLVDAKSDILYLSDIFEKLNVLNKELQGNDSTLFSCKEAITAFIGKLKLFWLNLGRREFAQFPSLASISTELLDADLAVYVDHLKQLHNDMETRFSDLLQMTVPDWFVDPFIADASEVDVTLQESVIELQNDTTARARFKRGGRHKLWINQDVYEKYPLLWKEVKLLLLAFPTSYLVETGFSRVMHLLSKTRNRLDIEKRGDLRLSLTSLEPNIDKLAALHQSQGSH
ncbi:zinc finger MYM-type protein 6-like [Oratosquilla oratoria]|uniref:zinc finger MYM-type protein 6-like n=1 Tax=Oratosquilla oratoria TaxID=337810 RepID=UPI003F7701FB